MTDILTIARAHRTQFLDAAEDAIAEASRLRERLTEAGALLRAVAEGEQPDPGVVKAARAFLGMP